MNNPQKIISIHGVSFHESKKGGGEGKVESTFFRKKISQNGLGDMQIPLPWQAAASTRPMAS